MEEYDSEGNVIVRTEKIPEEENQKIPEENEAEGEIEEAKKIQGEGDKEEGDIEEFKLELLEEPKEPAILPSYFIRP